MGAVLTLLSILFAIKSLSLYHKNLAAEPVDVSQHV
jgi:hypothetical protein